MLAQELLHQFGLVSREVVQNDVDLSLGRLGGDDLFQDPTNSWLVCREAVCPMTSPVCGFRAA